MISLVEAFSPSTYDDSMPAVGRRMRMRARLFELWQICQQVNLCSGCFRLGNEVEHRHSFPRRKRQCPNCNRRPMRHQAHKLLQVRLRRQSAQRWNYSGPNLFWSGVRSHSSVASMTCRFDNVLTDAHRCLLHAYLLANPASCLK